MDDIKLQQIYNEGNTTNHAAGLRAVYEAGLHPKPEPVVSGSPWKAETLYAPGDTVTSVKDGKETPYGCEVGGTSGQFEPTWTKTRTHDGTVTWKAL